MEIDSLTVIAKHLIIKHGKHALVSLVARNSVKTVLHCDDGIVSVMSLIVSCYQFQSISIVQVNDASLKQTK